MFPKQCPDCGSLNPPANSRCVTCRRDMTVVQEMQAPTLPEQGYQPPIETAEATFFMSLTALFAGVSCALGAASSTDEARCYAAAIDLLEFTLRRMLRERLGRPATEDEIKQFTMMLRPETLPEAMERNRRLMEERVPIGGQEAAETLTYVAATIEKLAGLLAYRPRADL